MHAHDALKIPHHAVLLCQSLRVMHEVHKLPWLDRYIRGRRTLVLFRGGAAATGFTVSAARLVLHASQAPVLALVNIDTVGLAAAARAQRLEALCIPSWAVLERHKATGSTPAARANQLLDSAQHPDIERAWKLLRWNPRGISAEELALDAPYHRPGDRQQ